MCERFLGKKKSNTDSTNSVVSLTFSQRSVSAGVTARRCARTILNVSLDTKSMETGKKEEWRGTRKNKRSESIPPAGQFRTATKLELDKIPSVSVN